MNDKKQSKDATREVTIAKMSDYYVRFIPDNILTTLKQDEICLIKELDWSGNTPKFICSETVQFADAGQNFEYVKCASCSANITEWWGNAMSLAYSDEHGFTNLEVITPCCDMRVSLHDLDYSLTQGFYKTMIEISPNPSSHLSSEHVANYLKMITKEAWRIIHARY